MWPPDEAGTGGFDSKWAKAVMIDEAVGVKTPLHLVVAVFNKR